MARKPASKSGETLSRQDTDAPDPDLLDALPELGDILTDPPARLQQQLYDAFDLQMLYNKEGHQVSIYAAITPATPAIIAAILADSSPDTSTTTPEPASTRLPVSDSPRIPMCQKLTAITERPPTTQPPAARVRRY
jgi:hypothetical protein